MKKAFNKVTKMVLLFGVMTSSAHAFDVKLIYSMNPGTEWSYTSDTGSITNYGIYKSYNLGIEIGYYKNKDKQGFGFGWHLGTSFPTSYDFWEAGTVFELGFAPGYSITEELAVKLELSFQFKNGWKEGASASERAQDSMAGFGYGLSAEYVFADHYVLGGAVKNYEYYAQEGSSSALVPEVSFAYRF